MNASHDSRKRCKSFIRAAVLGIAVVSLVGCDAASRPVEENVRSCLVANGGVSVRVPPKNAYERAFAEAGVGESQRIPNPTISQLEWGQTITSQGGMLEMAMGASRDTKIFPVRIHIRESTDVLAYWVFKDSFGTLKCVKAPGA